MGFNGGVEVGVLLNNLNCNGLISYGVNVVLMVILIFKIEFNCYYGV